MPLDSIGLDKVRVWTPDYLVDDVTRTGLTLKPGHVDLSTGQAKEVPLFVDRCGRKVVGSSAYLNTSLYQLTIEGTGVTLQFNPSKPYHQFELVDDDDEFKQRVSNVVDDLKFRGIRADWLNDKLTRVDVARNAIMSQPVHTYSQVWKWLRLKRAKNVREYPDGYGSSTGSTFGVIIYDKGKECENNMVNDRDQPTLATLNLIRCELQYKRNRGVQANLGCGTIADIQRLGATDLAAIYKKEVFSKLFNAPEMLTKYAFNFYNHFQMLEMLKNESERTAISNYLQMIAIPAFLQEHSPKQFGQLLDLAGFSKMTVSKWTRIINERIQVYGLWENRQETVGSLLSELQTRLAA